MTIRTKIFVGFFSIFAGVLLAAGLSLYVLVGDALREEVESGLFNQSSLLVEMVRTSVEVSVRNHLRAVAEKNRDILAFYQSRVASGELSEAEAKRRAGNVLLSQRIGKTGYIYCLRSDGGVVLHPVAANIGRNVLEYEFIRTQVARKRGYMEYHWKNPGESVARAKALYMEYYEPWDWIISASSYRDEFKNLVNVDDFRRSIAAQRFGPEGYAFVLDTAGDVVVHPFLSGNFLSQRDADGRPLIQEIVARKFGKLRYRWKNPGETEARWKIATFSYLPEVDWIVCASAYEADFDKPLMHLRDVAAGSVALVFLLGLAFAWWVGSSTTGSLRELVRGFGLARDGNFSVRLAPRSSDEMGRAAEYFNGFMERLEDYDKSLRREIRERQAAVQGEKMLRTHLQEVVDSMPAVVLGVDHALRVTLWNLQAEREQQVSTAQALGRPVTEVCPLCASFMDLVETAVRERRSVSRDKVMSVRDGQVRFHAVEASPLAGGDGAVIVINEVTHRAKIEEMMIQNEKMLSVGGLAAGMAHEINNPLGGILQGAQNVLRRVSPGMEANARAAEEAGCTIEAVERYLGDRGVLRMLEGIRESGVRAAKIVSNMLEFSRPSGASKTPCDVVELIEKALLLAESDYDLKKRYDFRMVTLVREYEPELPPVSCTAMEIEQVFLNLVRNAAQAMAGRPDSVLRLTARREGDWVRVEIGDNGPGMPEETKKRVFEPFFTTKEVGQGTGLGLSVSYFIITDNHGGTISVDSVPGQGATFVVRLPL